MIEYGELLMYIVTYFGLFTSIFFLVTLLERRKEIESPQKGISPPVTIMIPAYNEENTIEKTIHSLLDMDYPRNKLQIIVVDDGSTDNTLTIAKKYEEQGVLVLTKKNEGKGHALNYAIGFATGELVGALDADSYADRNAIKNMVGFFINPKVMAVTPSLKVTTPKNLLQKIQKIEYTIGIFLRKIFAFLNSIHVTPGPLSLYRKSFFDKYGAYDTSTITEDIEIALRIQSMHYIIENAVDAHVYTNPPTEFMPLLKQRLRWYRGFTDNVIRYSKLFSHKYGDLGMFILPASYLSVLFVILSMGYTIYRMSITIYHKWLSWVAINFDLRQMLNFEIDLFFLNSSPLFILGILSLLGGIALICLAKWMSQEKQKIKAMYLFYMFLYMPLFAIWWIVALYYKATGKKIKWAGRLG